jgi:hypothetical protein
MPKKKTRRFGPRHGREVHSMILDSFDPELRKTDDKDLFSLFLESVTSSELKKRAS